MLRRYHRRVELYGQEPEAELLAAFLPRLSTQRMVDVGAERGPFVEAMLRAGADEVHAIEPELANVAFLQERFAAEPRVTVHPFAVGKDDGEATLHLASDQEGGRLSFGHTLLERSPTDEIAWTDTTIVPVRSLDSLARSGAIPERIGILKIDTEGNDLAVLQGMGVLEPDVVMVEHWLELPESLGSCPWKPEDVTTLLAARGFSSFALLRHRQELVTLLWDDARLEAGEVGNLVFLHDRVAALLIPDVLASASRLAAGAAEVIDGLHRELEVRAAAAEETASLLTEFRAMVTTRDETIAILTRETEVQTAAAAERLEALNGLSAERTSTVERLAAELDVQRTAAAERLEALDRLSAERSSTLERLEAELDLQRNAAADRLGALEKQGNNAKRTVESLERERDIQAKAAAERQVTIDRVSLEHAKVVGQLEEELKELSRAAAERLTLLDALSAERELLAEIAAERLDSIERLSQELEVQAIAAEQRLAAMEGLERVRGSHGKEHGGWR